MVVQTLFSATAAGNFNDRDFGDRGQLVLYGAGLVAGGLLTGCWNANSICSADRIAAA